MSVYLVYDVSIEDQEVYAQYKPQAAKTIFAHGGEILVATDSAQTVEGTWAPSWFVVMRFESQEKAQAWMDSEDYAPWKKLRKSASSSQAIMAKERGA